MKKALLIILSGIFIVASCFCIDSYADRKLTELVISHKISSAPTIIIDAGHGGIDDGAIGFDGIKEKEINLSIALILYDYIMVSGLKAELVRDGDYEIYKSGEGRTRSDLYNRMDFINSIDNGILISVHQNHFENESEWGTQIWYSPNDEESRELADSILSTVKSFIQPENMRENKKSDDSYYLLYKAKKPSLMIECGFMSNKEENEKLQTTEYQRDLAFSILVGISGEL